MTRAPVAAAALGLTLAGCMGSPAMSGITPAERRCGTVVASPAAASVTWLHPVGRRDHERLEAWCRTLGPVVVEPQPTGRFGSARGSGLLRVSAWNVNAGAGDVIAFLRDEMELDCTGSTSRLAPGAPHFVLLAQEVLRRSNDIPDVPESWATPPPVTERGRTGDRIDIVQVASSCGLSLLYAPAARNGVEPRDGLREDKGNAVLSTLPLDDIAVIELPYEAARRVVPVATVRDAGASVLRVASVHLITTPPPWRVLLTANSARQRQALALIDALARIDSGLDVPHVGTAGEARGAAPPSGNGRERRRRGFAPTVPVLAGGDLNTFSRRETALRRLRAAFPASPPSLEVPTRPPFPTDHLLLNGTEARVVHVEDDSYRRAETDYGSDHYPVVARLRFSGP